MWSARLAASGSRGRIASTERRNLIVSNVPLSLNAQILGESGPALVVLHGLFGFHTNWRSFGRKLSGQCQVHLLDLRNHGDSPHSDTMDYPGMAADVLAYLDHHALANPILLGHSMGGKVAMTLALQNPERLRVLLVADIAPVRYDQGGEHRMMIEALLAVALENQTRAQIDEQVRAAIPDASIRNFLLQNLIRSKTGWHWRLNLAGLQNALPDLRGFPESDSTYPKSTLFIRGERSGYVLPGHRAEIRLRFPKHQLVTLKNAGHWLHVEQPEAFQSTVRSFLNHLSTPNP